jgi:GTP-dependent dephospho-CoA kinase
MRVPFADILSEPEFLEAVQTGALRPPFVSVGDIVSDTLIRHGIEAKLLVYDLITKRDEIGATVEARLEAHPARLVTVVSEPATLSADLVEAVKDALGAPDAVKIRVIGEEDLATLPVLAHCPIGGTVIYGMPNRGLVPVPVTPDARQRAVDWLTLMKVGPDA